MTLGTGIRRAFQVARAMGPAWVGFRLGYACRRRLGLLRRAAPSSTWDAVPLSSLLADPALADPARLRQARERGPRFLTTVADTTLPRETWQAWDREGTGTNPVVASDRLERGEWMYFDGLEVRAPWPPDWQRAPRGATTWDGACHWSELDEFAQDDIKELWEPARLASAFTFVRAWRRTGDATHGARFWRLFESLLASNPPNRGPHWKCGQEVALRMLAATFALHGLADCPETTDERIAELVRWVAVSAARIEANLGYALSQRNNHGVSEAAGLYTAGLLFPELRDAPRWRRRGRRELERLARSLIYDDGAFSQHSANYHRVALQLFLWCLRLAEVNGERFSDTLVERVGRSALFLHSLQDELSGRLPHYGENDGALVLPWSNSEPRDYRPLLQAAATQLRGERWWGEGPWDEAVGWLRGRESLTLPCRPPVRCDSAHRDGGCHTLRADAGHAMVRCTPRYRHRPGHADSLHVDIWWRGLNVARDSGTYSYNAPAPWDHPLARTAAHNTITVDGLDQMERAGRFLWIPWHTARVVRHDSPQLAEPLSNGSHSFAVWEGEHDGYRRLPSPAIHRRLVLRLGEEHWLVLDRVWSESAHDYRLHWHFPDWPVTHDAHATRRLGDRLGAVWTGALSTPMGAYGVALASPTPPLASHDVQWTRGDSHSAAGWWAPGYARREPAWQVVATARAAALSWGTLLGPGTVTLRSSLDASIGVEHWEAECSSGAVRVALDAGRPGRGTMLREATGLDEGSRKPREAPQESSGR